MQDLNTENYRTLFIKGLNRWKNHHIYGSEDSPLRQQCFFSQLTDASCLLCRNWQAMLKTGVEVQRTLNSQNSLERELWVTHFLTGKLTTKLRCSKQCRIGLRMDRHTGDTELRVQELIFLNQLIFIKCPRAI